MIILDEPYVSEEMKDYLEESGIPVLKNAVALRESAGRRFRLLDDGAFLKRLEAGERLYTVSENALAWLHRNARDRLFLRPLLERANVMKNKAAFRRLMQPMYPEFFFREVTLRDLAGLDVETLPLPLVLKPSVGFFSVGVYTIRTAEDWRRALADIAQRASSWTRDYPSEVVGASTFLLESCIPGDEYALDAYFDADGQAVIVNLMKHDFASDADVGDRLYFTSPAIIREHLAPCTAFLNRLNQAVGAVDFPVHIELRLDGGTLVPIECNPLRFAGWCCTDLTYFAFGFRTFALYLENRRPDWERLLAGSEDTTRSVIILNKPSHCPEVSSFAYDALCARFHKVLSLRKLDWRTHPVFGFLFTETDEAHRPELDAILKSDLTEFMVPSTPGSLSAR